MAENLRDVLDAAARGVLPPPDGGTSVVAQPSARDAGVVAFTAHSVVFTDEDEAWVREALAAADCDPLAAAMNPRFLAALMARTGRTAETVDVLSAAPALPGAPGLALTEEVDPAHPRVLRARTRRDAVRVWSAPGGVLVLGRGVAGRTEVSVEVAEGARHRGLGRALARAARHLSAGEPVWAQVAAGNARSLRAFRAAGYRPLGAEILLNLPIQKAG
ncbi:GNAT family N-acetyltransferase [Streptomyces sp. NPDC090306]|uniref:GNAT family N-acetyltransferase n=1 Tax=Streptomyces sp. NPDC090306 TaxID=3365961 RepID=UPI0037FC56EC